MGRKDLSNLSLPSVVVVVVVIVLHISETQRLCGMGVHRDLIRYSVV